MGKMPMIARILLGLIFFVFGIMGLLNVIPPPPNMPEKMMAFMTGIMATGYFFPLLKCTEIVCGAMLLANRFVALALVILAPIIINIVGVHAFLEPSGLPIALVIVVLEAYLAFFSPYKGPIKALFQAKPSA